LSAANPFSLPNYVVAKESVFAAELCCIHLINFLYRIKLSTANPFSLLNCVVKSELVFDAEFW
jgi:hypothetical protein